MHAEVTEQVSINTNYHASSCARAQQRRATA